MTHYYIEAFRAHGLAPAIERGCSAPFAELPLLLPWSDTAYLSCQIFNLRDGPPARIMMADTHIQRFETDSPIIH